jgi:DNA gyrase subunit B
VAEQILVNKRSRETAEKTRLNIKKKLSGTVDLTIRIQKSLTAAPRRLTGESCI